MFFMEEQNEIVFIFLRLGYERSSFSPQARTLTSTAMKTNKKELSTLTKIAAGESKVNECV